jgi:hypothetical protein
VQPALAQVLLVGITARYTSVRSVPPLPRLGGVRVDGSDAVDFPERSNFRAAPESAASSGAE